MENKQYSSEPESRSSVVRNSAARARKMLSSTLRMLQEVSSEADSNVKLRLARATEQVAEASGVLFELEHESKSDFDCLAGAVRARDHLRTALSALQAPEMAGSFPVECAEAVASALAIVFSAAKGQDYARAAAGHMPGGRPRGQELRPQRGGDGLQKVCGG